MPAVQSTADAVKAILDHERTIMGNAPDSVIVPQGFKGTPGPWKMEYSEVRGTPCVVSLSTWICGELQADNGSAIDDDESVANAHLIAAAPDLLEALQGVLRVANRKTVEFDAARAAVAKALGDQS